MRPAGNGFPWSVKTPASLYSIGIYPIGDALADTVRGVDLARNGEDGDKAMHRDHRIKNADERRDSRLVLRHHQLKQTVTLRYREAEHGHAGAGDLRHGLEALAELVRDHLDLRLEVGLLPLEDAPVFH